MKKSIIILLLLAGIKMSAETPTFFPRKFLLEHFTSANCNQCPMGMKYIVEYLDKQITPYIWVSHHAVYGTDEYTIPESNAIAMNYLGMNSVPSVVFNRSKQDELLVIGAWNIENLIVKDDTLAEASVVIDHQFDATTRRLDISVRGQVANKERTEYLLSILIKENGLVGKQEDAYCSWKGAKWQEYMHPRVVRDMVTATFGDTVKVENQAYHYSTSYVIDEEWEAENCCVVAYLTPLEKSPVINAEQAPLVKGTEGGEQYGPYGITEGKGPNTSISFDSVRVTQLGNGQLEMMLISSKTIKTNYFGICKQVGYLYVNTVASVLEPGTYPIVNNQSPIPNSHEQSTITAGYRVDEEERLGGSRLLYAVSADLKNGIVTPIHGWRMNAGNMVLDEAGNISINFTTYNGTTVTATAKYDFSVITNVEHTISDRENVKVLRNGQLLIEHQGQWYGILGERLKVKG
ncbi:MAG: Omp28-related outer membrane protein [Paludibacteraceae bacterium]|nr:Omp28-related outer membrane protein [Paludibacteraceae bacterium]